MQSRLSSSSHGELSVDAVGWHPLHEMTLTELMTAYANAFKTPQN